MCKDFIENKQLKVGFAYSQGLKPSMEDRIFVNGFNFCTPQGETQKVLIFGIFDGHNTSEAADYAHHNLLNYLQAAFHCHNSENTLEGTWKALRSCFKWIDRTFNREGGTTATIVIIFNDTIWTSQLGDSRAILCHEGKSLQISDDAYPFKERYKCTIEKMGGQVIDNRGFRLNGCLAMATAIGDHCLVGKTGLKCVSAKPKLTNVPLMDATLIIASDGMWDVIEPDRVSDFVNQLETQQKSPLLIAKNLVLASLEQGSNDNISVIVVRLSSLNANAMNTSELFEKIKTEGLLY